MEECRNAELGILVVFLFILPYDDMPILWQISFHFSLQYQIISAFPEIGQGSHMFSEVSQIYLVEKHVFLFLCLECKST